MTIYSLEQADQDLFAVYQVLYAKTDIEMWYDWDSRLKDTKFTDQCFWIKCDDHRIGGALILNGETVLYPFLISPFIDRVAFWKALFSCCKDVVSIKGVLPEDVSILLSLGFQLGVTRQVMCSPTDPGILAELPPGFSLHSLDESFDSQILASMIMKSMNGSIDYEVYGIPKEEDAIKDTEYLMKLYSPNNLSIYIFDHNEHEIAAICIAGISSSMPLGFAEIAEICVLPGYRGKQLGEYMLKHIRASAYKHAQVVKLCVTVGNHAESLYRKTGFIPGPPFANMNKRGLNQQ